MAMALTDCLDVKKKSQLLVTVEEILPNIIVVSYQHQAKLFEGVLLDSTRKLLPCGISVPPTDEATNTRHGDEMFAISQRFSYFQGKPAALDNLNTENSKRTIRLPARYTNARSTVRLRPRQVLCSKCRGICNENSENVNTTGKKRKCSNDETDSVVFNKAVKAVRPLRSSRDASPPEIILQSKEDSTNDGPVVKRKKRAITQSEALSNHSKKGLHSGKITIVGMDETDSPQQQELIAEEDPLSLFAESDASPLTGQEFQRCNGVICNDLDPLDVSNIDSPRTLRQNRSAGSIADLWDENRLGGTGLKAKTPVIKISYGEGTVLKISSKPHELEEKETDDKLFDKTKRNVGAKAAKKALKKAKKEARRKVMEVPLPKLINASSPSATPCLSPRYKTVLSPKSNVANSSPQHLSTKKHKHKGKHKKRHKGDKLVSDICQVDGAGNGHDEECLNQKLSINLKRLKSNAYMRCDSSSPTSPSVVSDSSDEPTDTVPDFPGNLNAVGGASNMIDSCKTSDGRQIIVGDVVWGKVHGFPWWPGKVLSITESRIDDGITALSTAHVAWYGSSTSSLVSASALNPFLDAFQVRYNKKKRGPYKEAIKQATSEAQRVDEVDGAMGMSCDVYAIPAQVDATLSS